jgi:hypothetical protein
MAKINPTAPSLLGMPNEIKLKIALAVEGSAQQMCALELILWPDARDAADQWQGNPSLWGAIVHSRLRRAGLDSALRLEPCLLPPNAGDRPRRPNVFNTGTDMKMLREICIYPDFLGDTHVFGAQFAPRSTLAKQIALVEEAIASSSTFYVALSAEEAEAAPLPRIRRRSVLFGIRGGRRDANNAVGPRPPTLCLGGAVR